VLGHRNDQQEGRSIPIIPVRGRHPVLVLGPENAQHLAAARWKQLDVQKALFEMARRPRGARQEPAAVEAAVFPGVMDKNGDNA
jgi:hypothetical protein